MKVKADIDSGGERIRLSFPYDPQAVKTVKSIPGSRFVPKEKGGPHWLSPLDLVTARLLREKLGESLDLGPGLIAWGREAVSKERNLGSLATAGDADLPGLLERRPEMVEWLRPYQRADVSFLAQASAINANEMGLGKTAETIGAVIESGLRGGAHLVICPKTSISTVWKKEIKAWLPDALVIGYHGELRKREKDAAEKAMKEIFRDGLNPTRGLWFVTTAPTLRAGVHARFGVEIWDSFVIDEFHKLGLANQKTLLSQATRAIKARRRWALSGTPMGGKPIKLFGGFQFVDPGRFTSKWRWAEQWLTIEDNGFGKVIGDLRPEREAEFYRAHADVLLRRLKSEVATELPPKTRIDVWCEMTPKQTKQYRAMEADAAVAIEDESLSAIGVLAEYTRLKQFANSACTIDGPKLRATTESGKLEYLLDRLAEAGIDPDDPSGDKQAVVASQFSETIEMVHQYLNEKGITAGLLTGSTKQRDRDSLVEEFQAGTGPRVICITTTAGGVSITLDRADTVHVLDETWNPDDQEQLEDRVHRISRVHNVTVYYYRSTGTVEERIKHVTDLKRITNEEILDKQRGAFLATIEG